MQISTNLARTGDLLIKLVLWTISYCTQVKVAVNISQSHFKSLIIAYLSYYAIVLIIIIIIIIKIIIIKIIIIIMITIIIII